MKQKAIQDYELAGPLAVIKKKKHTHNELYSMTYIYIYSHINGHH